MTTPWTLTWEEPGKIASPPKPRLSNNQRTQFQTLMAAATEERSRERDEQGHLPLHLALWHGAPLEVVLALLRVYPEAAGETATNSSWLPLHIALQAKAEPAVVRAILEARKAAAQACGAYGWLPIHLAARRDHPADVVEVLLHAHPDGLSRRAESGDTALALARKFRSSAAQLALQSAEALALDRSLAERRKSERQDWEDSDATSRRELQRLVQQRVDEQELAATLATKGAPEADAGAWTKTKEQEVMEAMKAQLAQEKLDKQAMQDQIAMEQEEKARLQGELDAANVKAEKRAKSPKKEKKEDMGDVADWKKCTAKSGKPFWYNKKTKKSVWKDPT